MNRLHDIFAEAFDELKAAQWVTGETADSITTTVIDASMHYRLKLISEGGYLVFTGTSDLIVPGEYQAKVRELLDQFTEGIEGRFWLDGCAIMMRYRHAAENFDALPAEINTVAQSLLHLYVELEMIVKLVLVGNDPAVVFYLMRQVSGEA